MCGLAGIVRFDQPGQASLPRVLAMQHQLRHRGPDGAGQFVGAHVALGHRRLALIDAPRGGQPMTSRDGRYTIVQNGEIYNFRELRGELAADWAFTTASDTEVLLAACVKWGEACLPRLNGMFAFFFWDEEGQTGFAARDLLGIKPLAYAQEDESLVVASEAKAIVATRNGAPRACREALLEYLVAPFFSGVEHSPFAGVSYLLPGHLLRVDPAGVQMARWGEYNLLGELREDSRALASDIAGTLRRAVERCLIADVPVGTFLSGGLDSSLLAALATEVQGFPLPTFTIQFEGQSSYAYARSAIVHSDDLPFAKLAGESIGSSPAVVCVDRRELATDLAKLAVANDALPAWEQELAQHHLAQAASRELKAVLVGDAADETHYGYRFLLDAAATSSPGAILSRFGGAPIRRDVLADPIAHFDAHYRQLVESAGHCFDTPLDRTLATTRLIVDRWLPRLLHNGDIHTMACSLEARVPFGDTELLAVARTVHPHVALQGGVEKAVLRAAASGSIPESIRTRVKSALPKDQGVAEVYQREAGQALARNAGFLGELLDLDAIATLCHPDRPLGEWEGALLFRVISLTHWCEHFGVRSL